MKKTLTFLATILLSFLIYAQDIRICPSCGWEVKAEDVVCGHCNAKLPAPKKTGRKIERETTIPVKSTAVKSNSRIIQLAEKTVRSNIASFRAAFEKDPALAYYYALNANAVQRLLPLENLSEDIRKKIVAGERMTFARLQKGRLPCRHCNSTGKIHMTLKKSDGRISVGPQRICPICKGLGYRVGFAPVSTLKLKLQKGHNHFVQERIAAGDIRLGRAFIPQELLDLLNTRQKALVMTGARVPCSECFGIGRDECSLCKGTGLIKCPNSGCENGYLHIKTRRRNVSHAQEFDIQKCPVCGGTGEILCTKCKGSGSLPCRRCQGSGTAPLCKKCIGEGIIPCKKCKGAGKVKGEICPECKGELVILCPTCHGEGVTAK